MYNVRSDYDTAHVNFVCAFACPLPLWLERIVACRVSLSSVFSGCTRLLLVESRFPDLLFLMISWSLQQQNLHCAVVVVVVNPTPPTCCQQSPAPESCGSQQSLPQVAMKGSTLSGFVQRSRLEGEVGRDLHSNKWEEV